MEQFDYKKIWTDFVNSLTKSELESIGKSQADVYWDRKEGFYLWAHDHRNEHGDLKVFDSYADEDFDARECLMLNWDGVYEQMQQVENDE